MRTHSSYCYLVVKLLKPPKRVVFCIGKGSFYMLTSQGKIAHCITNSGGFMLLRIFECFLLLIFGSLLAEGCGYTWHWRVSHYGFLKWIFDDVLRSRHYDHHMHKYGVTRLSSSKYMKSCEITFHPMGVLVMMALIGCASTGIITWQSFALIMTGSLLYGIYGLGKMHDLYHIDEIEAQKIYFLQFKLLWKVYVWLRDYHLVHHYVNKNYAIVIPIFDWLGGTYISPKRLVELRENKRLTENLFPSFNPRRTNSCGKPLFEKPKT
jgi:sterol desaturase/sphingolipid hydroxylase (fatty acid hydroxylase superfamily)